MIIGVVLQQPGESFDYDIDFMPAFGASDPLDLVSFTVVPATGLDVSFDKASDTTGKLWIGGGASGVDYKIDIAGFSAGGRTARDEVLVKIKET